MNYQEQIDKLKSRLDSANNTLGNVKAEIDKLEEEMKQGQGKWMPKVGETYYRISSIGRVHRDINNNDEETIYFLKTNIPFKTEAEAEEYKAYQLAIAEAKYDFSEEEWKDISIKKWALCINALSNSIDAHVWGLDKYLGMIYFKTNGIARAFAKKYEPQILKWGI